MWEKPLRATARGFIHTPVVASNFGGSNGSGGSYHAKSLRPGLHRARSPGRRRSCRNGCDRSCRGELRGLRWSLRKRLSPSLRLAPLVIVGSYGTRSSPTHPITRRHDSQLANPPSSQASQQSTRTLCIWPRPVRRCPETTESCGLRGHSSHPASAFRDCPADVGLDARVKAVHDETGSAALVSGRHLRTARDRRQKLLSSGFRGTAEPRLIKVGCSIFRHDAWRRLRWDPMLHRSKEERLVVSGRRCGTTEHESRALPALTGFSDPRARSPAARRFNTLL